MEHPMGLKSIFDGLYVNQLIQKNERDETIIYPHGMMGRGYVLPAEREAQVRDRLRLTMLVALVIGIGFGMTVMRMLDAEPDVSPLIWGAISASAVLLFSGLIYYQSRLATGLQPVVGPRPSLREWLRRGHQARPAWTYWFSLFAGVFLLTAAAAAIASGTGVLVLASGVFLLLIGGLGAVDGVLGLKEHATLKTS
jgi:hypothetical protein